MAKKTYQLDGIGRVQIGDDEHVATGGEGTVSYAGTDKSKVVKVYLDPPKMVQRGTFARLQNLIAVTHPGVVGPKGLAYAGGEPVGFWMPYVSGEGLSVLSVTDWRNQNKFGDREAHLLVAGMFDIVRAAHKHNFTVVDPNQNNWLADLTNRVPKAYCLDVDSWIPSNKVPSHVACCPAVMDYHAVNAAGEYACTHLTDWFGVSTVAFEVLVGIHPFRGFVPGFPFNKYEPRIRGNASVMRDEAEVPMSVRDLKCINGPLFDWFYETYEKGHRSEPPDPLETKTAKTQIGVVMHAIIKATGLLVFDELLKATVGDPFTRVFHCGIAVTANGRLFDLRNRQEIGRVKSSATCEVIKIENDYLVGDWEQSQRPTFSYISTTGKQQIPLQLLGKKLVSFENRMFLVTDRGLTEIKAMVFGPRAVVAPGQNWSVLVNATKWFDGCGVMDAVGNMNLVLPHGADNCQIVRIRELDGVKTVAAKAGNRFVAVMTLNKAGEYHRMEFTFDSNYTSYKLEKFQVDTPTLNLAVLPKQVCASIEEDGKLKIHVPASGERKIVEDAVTTQMALANWENTVVYLKDGAIWSVRMK